MMAILLIALTPLAGWAGSPSSPEEEAKLRGEWEQARENQQRALRENEKRIADIYAKAPGSSADGEKRAEKITQDRVAGIQASLKGGGKSKRLTQMAEKARSEAGTLVEMYTAQDEYLGLVTAEWAEAAERKKLKEATTALQKNMALMHSHVARLTEAAGTTSTLVGESGVLEKAAQTEAAAREVGERLSARWERERAAREREREQRERETGERARGQRW